MKIPTLVCFEGVEVLLE